MDVEFRKLTLPSAEIAEYSRKWQNDPQLTHLIRVHQDQASLDKVITVTVKDLTDFCLQFHNVDFDALCSYTTNDLTRSVVYLFTEDEGKDMLTPNRVYVSVSNNGRLSSEHLEIKRGIFDRIQQAGFQPQELKVTGDLADIPWSFENVQSKLGRCKGAVVLGLVRWDVWDAQSKYKFVTAYNNFEGALARAAEIPTFILMHEQVHKAGIVLKGRSPYYVKLPDGVDSTWLQTNAFSSTFDAWVSAVNRRCQVFLGHTVESQAAADQISSFLTAKGVSVMQQAVDASFSMDDIQRASKACMGGIFLFVGEDAKAAPARGNLLLTAGYFLHAKKSERVLMMLQKGARLPVGLQKQNCLSIQSQNDIASLEKDLEEFVVRNL